MVLPPSSQLSSLFGLSTFVTGVRGGGRGAEGESNVYLLLPESNIVYGMGTNLKTQKKAVFNIEHSK